MQAYSFFNQIFLISGVPISGWMDGDDSIEVTFREDAFTDVVGNDGDMAISLNPNQSAEVSINLKQTSASNLFLSTQLNAARNGAFVPLAILWKDVKGTDLGAGSNAYIKKMPDVIRGKAVQGHKWTLVVERMDLVLGSPNGI